VQDKELLVDFVIEARDHLADVENQFLAIEQAGANIDVELVNEVFRAIHSIKGAAGFLGLTRINDLAHNLENLLNMMRNAELVPTSPKVDAMLRAADTLRNMILDVENSNDVDVSAHVAELSRIAADENCAASDSACPAEPTLEELAEPADNLAATTEAEATVAPAADMAISVAPSVAIAQPPAAPPLGENENKGSSPTVEANIRVSVGVLDSLMNLAGELVLSRNQLLQAISSHEKQGLEAIAARLDQVTSELQEAIMQTRMQPIGTVFGRFPRVVRDLSSKLGKQCELVIDGKEVEVDKTIVEAIGDPLTHLVRNSIDHGFETPDQRLAAGKNASGTLNLRACYQAGKVRIEIADDGRGIDPKKLKDKAVAKGIISAERAEQMSDREAVRLIFAPGFSTAEKVTDVSGRGVGMDVVRTNVAKIGGTVDVESVLGQGTTIVVTLPLTLAIIPSLIVQAGGDRFAIPQVSIAELVRIRESERESRLGRVKDAEVLRLRGNLLPLVRLAEALDIDQGDNPRHCTGATNIIVVDTGQCRFGVVVDALHDSEEIVVKPLGRHYKNCHCLAGATILGDGHVALILDIPGLAADEEISSRETNAKASVGETVGGNTELQSVLLFEVHPKDQFAVSMDVVSRIERIRGEQLDTVGGQKVLQYRNTTLPLLEVNQLISTRAPESTERMYVVVFEIGGREVGMIAPELLDIRDVSTDVDTTTFREPGVIGSLVVEGRTIRQIDMFALAEVAHPEWFTQHESHTLDENHPPCILLAEDSTFFRNQVQAMFEDKGYRVEPCEDGLMAWEKLASGQYDIDVVVTDIEMPNLNGFELCGRIKADPKTRELPVIALTSLAATKDVQHGLDVGIDDYQIKMDREKLLASLKNFVDHSRGGSKSAQRAAARPQNKPHAVGV
jgi:two-component system chemotaxis sensor kinase CheA